MIDQEIYKIPMEMIMAIGGGKFLPYQCYRNGDLAYALTGMYAKYRNDILGYLAAVSDACAFPVRSEYRELQLLQTIYMQCADCRGIRPFGSSSERMKHYAACQRILPCISRDALKKSAYGIGSYAQVVHDLLGACVVERGLCKVLDGIEYEDINEYGKDADCLQPVFELIRRYADGEREWHVQALSADYAGRLQSMCRDYVDSVLDGVPASGESEVCPEDI